MGLKLSPAAAPEAVVVPRIYCIGPAAHFRLSGWFVGEVENAVDVSSEKMTLSYVPGPYLGKSQPHVDPPLKANLRADSSKS